MTSFFVSPAGPGEGVVDEGRGDAVEGLRGQGGFDGGQLHLRGGRVDLLDPGVPAGLPPALDGDQPRRGQREQRAHLLRRIVAEGDLGALRQLGDRAELLGVEGEREDLRGADRGQGVVVGDVVVGQVAQMLELVEVHLLLRQRRIRLFVITEIDEFHRDPLLGGLTLVDVPVRQRDVVHPDPHDVGGPVLPARHHPQGEDDENGQRQHTAENSHSRQTRRLSRSCPSFRSSRAQPLLRAPAHGLDRRVRRSMRNHGS